jgi:hypothetical protein
MLRKITKVSKIDSDPAEIRNELVSNTSGVPDLLDIWASVKRQERNNSIATISYNTFGAPIDTNATLEQ